MRKRACRALTWHKMTRSIGVIPCAVRAREELSRRSTRKPCCWRVKTFLGPNLKPTSATRGTRYFRPRGSRTRIEVRSTTFHRKNLRPSPGAPLYHVPTTKPVRGWVKVSSRCSSNFSPGNRSLSPRPASAFNAVARQRVISRSISPCARRKSSQNVVRFPHTQANTWHANNPTLKKFAPVADRGMQPPPGENRSQQR